MISISVRFFVIIGKIIEVMDMIIWYFYIFNILKKLFYNSILFLKGKILYYYLEKSKLKMW